MNQTAKSVFIGAAAGAVLGAAFAWVASAMNDDDPNTTAATALQSLGPMDYFSLGIAILTLARQFGGMIKKA
jgi:hypothetical protein